VEEDPLIGRQLDGRYTITGVLGRGGMGKVYKAVQAPLDRQVALKVLSPSFDEAKDPGFVKRFFLEASVTAKLSHPNTITIFDYGRTEDGIFYIAMEYLQGRTLSALLAQGGPLEPARAIHVIAQIARSVREAHGLGIIHRDLKPANIMVLPSPDGDDFVKVLDFGLVKFFDPAARAADRAADDDLTQAGMFMGSPHYIAPEQARNQPVDPRVDVYSLGVLFWQLLVGRVPFTGKTPLDVIVKHVNEMPPAPSQANPGGHIPPELDRCVLKMLAKEPKDRFQTMDALLEGLKQVGFIYGTGANPALHSGSSPTSGQRPASDITELGSDEVEVVMERTGERTGPAEKKTGKRALVIVLVALGIAGGFAITWAVTRPPKVEPVTTAPPKPGPEVPVPTPPTPGEILNKPPTNVTPGKPENPPPTVGPAKPDPGPGTKKPPKKPGKNTPEGYKDDPY
jgi:serine/threonine-protein kinase